MAKNIKSSLEALLPIVSGGLRIRKFLKSDISATYLSWLNDEEVVKYSNQRFIKHDRDSSLDYLKVLANSDSILLMVETLESKALGTMSVHFNSNHGTADVGILLGEKSVWGSGIGLTCWKMLLDALQATPEVRKVTAGTMACNLAMYKIALRSGMVEEGRRIKQELFGGEYHDLVYFGYFPSG